MNIFDAAHYINQECDNPIIDKLHCLLYYCQAWNIVWHDEPCFDVEFQAWAAGPAIPFMRSPILEQGSADNLSSAEKAHITRVLEIYGYRSAKWLYDLVASEAPYTKSRIGVKPGTNGNNPISNDLMRVFYSSLEEKRNKYNLGDIVYDPRNVADEFKFVSNDDIRNVLRERSLPYSVLMQHIDGDWNISTVMRNANAFGCRDMYYFGRRQVDKRGALGVKQYSSITHLATMEEVKQLKARSSKFVAFDNIPGAVDIRDYKWEKNCVVILGEEGPGICQDLLDMADDMVMIPQLGSVRSVNVGTASGIAMYDIMNKWK